MKLSAFTIALGITLGAAGAASACNNPSICGSGWQDRGNHGSYGGGYGSGSGYGAGYGSGYGSGTGYGGAGYGGGGGNGYGGGGGKGYGGAGGSANASNKNWNDNYNSVSGNNTSTNTANGYGGSASIASGAVQNTNANSQTQNQSQSIANSGNSNLSNAGNSNVSVAYTNIQRQQPVATAYAAPLVAGADTCMGSTSVGGQGITIGFSVATTWTDKNCVRLKNSRELNAMGMGDAACELLAMDRDVGEAIRRTGRNCGYMQHAVIEIPPSPPPPPVRCCEAAPPPPPCCQAPASLPPYEQEPGNAYMPPRVPYGERG